MYQRDNSIELTDSCRIAFSKEKLVYHEKQWYTSLDCIWHESVKVGKYLPIKSSYPSLESFFVRILRVKDATLKFILEELTKASITVDSEVEWTAHRELLLNAGTMFTDDCNVKSLGNIVDALREKQFLPCRLGDVKKRLCAADDDFYIADSNRYEESFAGKLYMLDYSYQELTTLHGLLGLVDVAHRYLSKSVEIIAAEGDSVRSPLLTKQFRECAYALSWLVIPPARCIC